MANILLQAGIHGCGTQAGFVPSNGSLQITFTNFIKCVQDIASNADAGLLSVSYLNAYGTWTAVTADPITGLLSTAVLELAGIQPPARVGAVQQVIYSALAVDATVAYSYSSAGHSKGATPTTTGTQMTCPRNVKAVFAGTASTFPVSVTVTGLTNKYKAASETFTFSAAGTQVGTVAFISIAAAGVVLGSAMAAGDTLAIQLGSVIGLPFAVDVGSSVVVYINGVANTTTYEGGGTLILNTANNTIALGSGSISGSDAWVIYAQPVV